MLPTKLINLERGRNGIRILSAATVWEVMNICVVLKQINVFDRHIVTVRVNKEMNLITHFIVCMCGCLYVLIG